MLYRNHTDYLQEWTLNNPRALNSVDTEMCTMMCDKLKEWHQKPATQPKLMIMKGAGEKAFCAGGDIVSIYKARQKDAPLADLIHFFGVEYLLDYSLS